MTTDAVGVGDLAAVERCKESYARIREGLAQVIVGQGEVIEQVLIAVVSRGHALLEGVPGLAKTLLVSSLAEATDLSFKRIQFTPDLMPSDVTGTQVIQEDPVTARRGVPIPARSALCEPDPRRRDQPHAAQDPGSHARSDARAAGQRRRRGASATGPVLRAGHAESAGTGRNLPAAGGPVGSVPSLHQSRLSFGCGGMGDRPASHDRLPGQGNTLAFGRGDPGTARSGASRAGERPGARVRLGTGAGVAAGNARGAGVRRSLARLGRRASGTADAGHLRQGSGNSPRSASCDRK